MVKRWLFKNQKLKNYIIDMKIYCEGIINGAIPVNEENKSNGK